MSFRITGLSPDPFIPLFDLPPDHLNELGVIRYHVEEHPGFPDRIELHDAAPGQTVLLLNHFHLVHDTPYKASHAIFVREGASIRFNKVNKIPPSLHLRPQSLRAFDEKGMMLDADLANGVDEIEALIERLFHNQETAFLHAHNARQGCYSALIERA